MILADVAIYIFYAFLITTITGGAFSLLWLLLRHCLGEGNEVFLTRCMRIGEQFYVIPVWYLVILWSKGDTMLLSPWMAENDSHVFLFQRSWVITALMILLTAVILINAAAAFRKYLKERKEFRSVFNGLEKEDNAHVLACCERMKAYLGIHRRITLYRSCEGSMPCVIGKIRRRIVIPKGLEKYSDRELAVIFAHELMHCKRHDLFFKAEFLAVSLIHAVNPLTRRMKENHKDYTEIACDLETCEKCKDLFTYKEYCSVLLELSVKQAESAYACVMGIAEEKSELRKRVEAMLRYKESKRMKKRVAVLLAVLLVFGSSITAFAAGDGIVALHNGIYQLTSVTRTEELSFTNTLEERVISAEEFASYNSIVMEGGVKESRAGGQIDWTMSAGATYSTTSHLFEEGQIVGITVYTDPEDQDIEVGLENINGGAVSVTGNGSIMYQFTVRTTGHYRIFVKNCSNARITVGGAFTY